MPPREQFIGAEEYYSTLFHELIHSTGHESRLNRAEIAKPSGFGSDPYAREELVAEMGATFLCGRARIEQETLANSAAYIQNWIGKLRSDPKLVVLAAASAQKATDFILAEQFKSVRHDGSRAGGSRARSDSRARFALSFSCPLVWQLP
jgi:antirestriction protein ArdC